ncbi:MAG TPA: LPS export ABC transporter periplasmic protein LptC [Chitinophagaceae bacterium]|nr:LPS export ABC transporter periplasmic protein LptC [Chitinophagaceae bacterium]MCC6634240.1 LPS export ABC transporter periplasmic protein LptC [Chitinophagaceae bacterium]HMZ45805.1 LPS export ABC transporter periplasmic protein LptC [Chitinophagaceae bacterium]HNF29330.1 LPS export ABC transporter periplasmic protein LptC [Chitinophagaceae bacterium]HNM34807.1 LPS export ABC transporter periplasmic protein LptC [Chitinophagaceae bacterium]
MISNFKHITFQKAVLVVGCFFVFSCENKIETVRDLGKATLGVEEGKNIESFISQSGKMRAKLNAPIMLRYLLDTPKIEFTKTLFVSFYDDTLGIESNLFAKYGRYLENDNKVYLKDSVVVYNIAGDTLWTSELYWNQDTEEFFTNKPVRVKREFNNKYIHSIGVRANQNLKDITFYKIQPDSYFIVSDSIY